MLAKENSIQIFILMTISEKHRFIFVGKFFNKKIQIIVNKHSAIRFQKVQLVIRKWIITKMIFFIEKDVNLRTSKPMKSYVKMVKLKYKCDIQNTKLLLIKITIPLTSTIQNA
jgi:hypothetical protein